MLVVKCFHQAHKMRSRRHHNQDMEDLVRASPNIKSAWLEPLWYSSLANISTPSTWHSSNPTHTIESSAGNIQRSLGHDIRQANLSVHLDHTVSERSMDHRYDGAETHGNKHASAKRSPLGCSEAIESRDCNTADRNNRDLATSQLARHSSPLCSLPSLFHLPSLRLQESRAHEGIK